MRHAPPGRLRPLLLAAAIGIASGPALAATRPAPDAAREQLQAAERDRAARLAAGRAAAERARAAQAEEARLAASRVEAASRLRVTEDQLAEVAARMDALSRRQAEAEARLKARAAAMAPLLPLIERLSLYPAETLLAVPEPPERALRAVQVLRGISRQLEEDAAALRAQEAEIAGLKHQAAVEAPKLAAARAAQAAQAGALDRQLDQARQGRQDAEDAAAEAERHAAADAAQADTLRGVLAQLEADRRAAEARAREEADAAARKKHAAEAEAARQRQAALARPAGPGLNAAAGDGAAPVSFAAGKASGRVVSPVAGHVVRAFGAASDAGPAQGMSYQAPPAARVVSPCGGKVVFAAPFRSFGLLLIVDCGGGYHFVLAGLERIDVQVGRSVQAGEPVGVMPGWDPGTPGSRPALYVELRRNGQPVNPAPWLKAQGLR